MFDARLHPSALSDADVGTLKFFGVAGALVVSDGSPRATVEGCVAHFDEVLGQTARLNALGIRAWAALGLHPHSLPRRGAHDVIAAIPARCGASVKALGLMGLLKGGAGEEEALTEQLALAKTLKLPVIIASCVGQRAAMTRRVLALVKAAKLPRNRVLIDGATAATVRLITACGYWAGLTLHPQHLDAAEAVALVRTLGAARLVLGSAGGDGASDIVSMARAHAGLLRAGLSVDVVERVTKTNAATWLQVRVR